MLGGLWVIIIVIFDGVLFDDWMFVFYCEVGCGLCEIFVVE